MALQECLSVFLAAEDHMSTQFTWKEEFNIGVDNIDKEHQQLFEGINSLFLLTQKKKRLDWRKEQPEGLPEGDSVIQAACTETFCR